MAADALVFAGVGGAGCQDIGAGGPAIRQLAKAGEAGRPVHARALVQARIGRTLINVDLAQGACTEGKEKKHRSYMCIIFTSDSGQPLEGSM